MIPLIIGYVTICAVVGELMGITEFIMKYMKENWRCTISEVRRLCN